MESVRGRVLSSDRKHCRAPRRADRFRTIQTCRPRSTVAHPRGASLMFGLIVPATLFAVPDKVIE
jgi:hypothetical protein